MQTESVSTDHPLRVCILFSGRGGNLQALAAASEALNIQIVSVICNRPDAGGLRYASQFQLPVHIVDHNQFESRQQFEQQLTECLDKAAPELIVLAGFMRVLTDAFVQRFQGRMINLHPSLLPLYPGLHTHAKVLQNADPQHGSSVHFVTPELDGGPVIAQYRMPVQQHDTAESLAARLAPHEHRLLLAVVALFARRAILLEDNQIFIDGQPLQQPLRLDYEIQEIVDDEA